MSQMTRSRAVFGTLRVVAVVLLGYLACTDETKVPVSTVHAGDSGLAVDASETEGQAGAPRDSGASRDVGGQGGLGGMPAESGTGNWSPACGFTCCNGHCVNLEND